MKVAIVGSGPVGLVCAHLLGLQRISTLLIERQPTLASHPSAHFIHSSSVEVLRDIGVLQPLLKEMPPSAHWRHYNYCESVTGKVYRRHDHFLTAEAAKNKELSPWDPVHFPQSKLVRLLAERLPSTCDLRLNCEVDHVEQQPDKVRLRSKSGETFEADYVLACDGAHSRVRSLLGIPMVGTHTLQNFLNIHLTSRQLGELCLRSPCMLYFIYNARAVEVLVMHNALQGDFVMQVPFLPPLENFASYTQKDFLAFADAAAGRALSDVVINSVKPWKMSAEHAAVLRRGRVFLVGDSAHKLPPAGGFGMNLGIGDASNIAWKLPFPQLLDSYEQERLPRIRSIISLSRANYEKTVRIAQMLNLDLHRAEAFEKVCEWLPLGKHVFSSGLQLGRLMITERRAEQFLKADRNLLGMIFPEADLQMKYEAGFLAAGGGGLAPSAEVQFEGQRLHAREVPGQLLRATGQPHFVHCKGQGDTEVPVGLPVRTVDIGEQPSFVMRPDSVLYSSASRQ